jgi:hypothetical protein
MLTSPRGNHLCLPAPQYVHEWRGHDLRSPAQLILAIDWDLGDNLNSKWVLTGVPCQLINGWNHVTLQAQRGLDDSLLYEPIELNGTTYAIKKDIFAGRL